MWAEMKREEKERANRWKEKCTEAIEKEGEGNGSGERQNFV